MRRVRIRARDIEVGDAVLVGDRWERVDHIEDAAAPGSEPAGWMRFVTFATGYRRPFRWDREYDVVPKP